MFAQRLVGVLFASVRVERGSLKGSTDDATRPIPIPPCCSYYQMGRSYHESVLVNQF